MTTYYIPTLDEKTLEQAQELLFALGYKWSFGTHKLEYSYDLRVEALCVTNYNLSITYVTRISYCEEQKYEPITLNDLTKKLILGETFYDQKT
jgi:hypothetical protein